MCMWTRWSKSEVRNKKWYAVKNAAWFFVGKRRYLKTQINSDLWRVITVYTVSVWPFPQRWSDRCTSLTCLNRSDVKRSLSVMDQWRVWDDPEMLVSYHGSDTAQKHNRIMFHPNPTYVNMFINICFSVIKKWLHTAGTFVNLLPQINVIVTPETLQH